MRTFTIVVALLLLLLLGNAARAEPSPEPDDERSPATAVAVSVGVTAAGVGGWIWASHITSSQSAEQVAWAAGTALFAIGPTMGHVYAGHAWNTGLKWRLASLGVAAVGGGVAFAACSDSCGDENPVIWGGGALVVGAGLSFGAATLYEMFSAGGSASTYNRKHAPSITITPTAGRTPGLALAGRF